MLKPVKGLFKHDNAVDYPLHHAKGTRRAFPVLKSSVARTPRPSNRPRRRNTCKLLMVGHA